MSRFLLNMILAAALVGFICGCSTTPAKPAQPPAGYSADVTPGNDGSALIGGAP